MNKKSTQFLWLLPLIWLVASVCDAQMVRIPATGTNDGYLSSNDWSRFDAAASATTIAHATNADEATHATNADYAAMSYYATFVIPDVGGSVPLLQFGTNSSQAIMYLDSSNTLYFGGTFLIGQVIGDVQGATIRGTNFYMAGNPVMSITTNIVAVYGAGNTTNNGIYIWSPTAGVYTNEQYGTWIWYQNPTWYLVNSNGQNQYSAGYPALSTWSVVNGASAPPSSAYGLTHDMAAERIDGWISSTNLAARLWTANPAVVGLSQGTNAGDFGIGGTLTVNGIDASGTIGTSDIFQGNASGLTNAGFPTILSSTARTTFSNYVYALSLAMHNSNSFSVSAGANITLVTNTADGKVDVVITGLAGGSYINTNDFDAGGHRLTNGLSLDLVDGSTGFSSRMTGSETNQGGISGGDVQNGTGLITGDYGVALTPFSEASQNAFAAGGGSGQRVVASGTNSTAPGGYDNIASGFASTIPGGSGNRAAGAASLAGGLNAHALYDGDVVINASANASAAVESTGPGEFTIAADNAIRLLAPIIEGPGGSSFEVSTNPYGFATYNVSHKLRMLIPDSTLNVDYTGLTVGVSNILNGLTSVAIGTNDPAGQALYVDGDATFTGNVNFPAGTANFQVLTVTNLLVWTNALSSSGTMDAGRKISDDSTAGAYVLHALTGLNLSAYIDCTLLVTNSSGSEAAITQDGDIRITGTANITNVTEIHFRGKPLQWTNADCRPIF